MINGQEYKVSIFGDQYVLKSDEPSDQIKQAADTVDSLMKEIAGTARLETKQVAVLAALQLAHRILTLERLQRESQDKIVASIDQELLDLGLFNHT
jgi:cell division protein ZapA (FtsZ GTPase activity inhibitor)